MSALDTLVYVSQGGRRYHDTVDCPALYSGQELFSGWGTFTVWRATRTTRTTPTEAFGRGRLPCHVCLPGFAAALFRDSCGNDFGHTPWFTCLPNFTKGYACARCRRRVRCVTAGSPEDSPRYHLETHAVPWPCTSAIVLGLAPRKKTAH